MRIRNYSQRTIQNYSIHLKDFYHYTSKELSKITTEDLKNYLYHRLTQDNITVSTINQIISSWKIVYIHLLDKKWEDFRIVRPRENKVLPEILSQSEAISLVNAPSNLKHKAILHLMYSTGIRREELLRLTIRDIDSARMIINIRQGKGKKDRQVVLHSKVLDLLRDYYQKYHPSNYLFEGQRKQQPYSATSLANILKTSARKVGITKRVSPHILRHCFATHMLERGVNLKVIQQLMGHSSIKTTSIYLSLINIDSNSLPNVLEANDTERD